MSTTNAGHTPGPWNKASYLVVARTPQGEKVVASCKPDNDKRPLTKKLPESLANARLIASTPDLLEVCENLEYTLGLARLFKPYGASGPLHSPVTIQYMKDAHAQIAKARGEA